MNILVSRNPYHCRKTPQARLAHSVMSVTYHPLKRRATRLLDRIRLFIHTGAHERLMREVVNRARGPASDDDGSLALW